MSDPPRSQPPDPTDPEAPPTANALASWAHDLEDKIIAKLAENHDEQLTKIETLMLRLYQEHAAPFWLAIQELQTSSHATSNATEVNTQRLDEHDRQLKLHAKQITSLEKFRAEEAAKEIAEEAAKKPTE